MREREVKKTLSEHLRADGFKLLDVRYRSRRGIDIEALCPEAGPKVYIEVKGERSGPNPQAKRRAALGEALLQVLEVYDGFSVCAIALPDTRGFRSLVARVHPPLKALGIHVVFVDEKGFSHLGPDSPTPLPQPISSLRHVLCP
ncbi:MAG TPA: hypothetical protein ENF77_02370 [Candidatus Acetothermia bacterium]|nr:hypothetical protein [Candidatus Bipolaricaulota bacterium]HDI11152.1 hypothetical protein [Candidatus Acetothermia bacterium]